MMTRYMYSEILGRWRTADLLIGLAYLARREGQEHPVADIAAKAQPIGLQCADAPEQSDVLVWLKSMLDFCLLHAAPNGLQHQACFAKLVFEETRGSCSSQCYALDAWQ